MTAPLNRVDTTIASAGTGKTTSLVRLIAAAIAEGTNPEHILGTTFTNKAADELTERARAHLVRQGKASAATGLLNARLGTVNSVCGQLVSEFALDLGRSPATEVIGEDAQGVLFATAADAAIRGCADELLALGHRLGILEEDGGWRSDVRRIIGLARANGLDPDRLHRSAARSKETLLCLLPEPETDEAALDRALLMAVRHALDALGGMTLTQKGTEALTLLRSVAAIMGRGEQLAWSSWAKLAKLAVGVKEAPLVQGVKDAAAAHPRHPRLRADLAAYIDGCFACAAGALAAYQRYKDERGLLDFTDQETLALAALRRPDLQDRLKERISRVFVDEVQDSSPLQVALFTELARIAEHSVWVGDPKQAIYGFRDTDARLTLAASTAAAAATGGAQSILSTSYRSRPGLVDFFNDCFTPAFRAMGMSEEACRFSRANRPELADAPPALSTWCATGKNNDRRAAAVAAGVRDALGTAEQWPVKDGAGVRPLRAGDIAILCRTHDDIDSIASALSALGLPVAVEHGKLFTAPEIQLATAALRWTADRSDLVALAEMARLVDPDPESDRWLQAALDPDARQALEQLIPFCPTLGALRDRQMGLTPAELLDAIIESCDLAALASRWGTALARVENLETLRGLARAYEEECNRLRSPATAGGLVLWLEAKAAGGDCNRPASLDPNAVRVMTYWGAKGLEWPLVIMMQLEKEKRGALFSPCAEADGAIDWSSPLAGRWLRFWPWPYGAHKKDVFLDAAAANSEIGKAVELRAREESVRLLYVGMTRARDYLVMVQPENKRLAWLDDLIVGDASAHVTLPTEHGNPVMVGGIAHPCRFQVLAAAEPEERPVTQLFLARPRDVAARRPLHIRPSDAVGAERFAISGRIELGARVPLSGEADMQRVGQALHAIIACDDKHADPGVRLQRAQAIFERWGVRQLLAEDCLAAADRLWSMLDERFRPTRVRREVPVHAYVGDQLVRGVIDLLLETSEGFVIIDHKSFPGSLEKAEQRALGHAAQLRVYAQAIEAATARSCAAMLIHMPILGRLLLLSATERAERMSGPAELA